MIERKSVKQFSAAEMADAVKVVFEMHGNDLATVVTRIYLEAGERIAALEARVAQLEARKR